MQTQCTSCQRVRQEEVSERFRLVIDQQAARDPVKAMNRLAEALNRLCDLVEGVARG